MVGQLGELRHRQLDAGATEEPARALRVQRRSSGPTSIASPRARSPADGSAGPPRAESVSCEPRGLPAEAARASRPGRHGERRRQSHSVPDHRAASRSSGDPSGWITYSGKKGRQQAEQKAAQPRSRSSGPGEAPDQDILVRSWDATAGAVCDNPATALGRRTPVDQMTKAPDFVGRRPINRRFARSGGEALILQTYCPEELQEFRTRRRTFKTDDVLKN
jgi:hypothetical protein